LDQSFGRKLSDYQNLLPKHCHQLLGNEYTLLRSVFAEYRNEAIRKHLNTIKIENIFVSIGGTDPLNVTDLVINALRSLQKEIPALTANIVLASNATHKIQIEKSCQEHDWINLLIDSQNMAELMLEADLAIGASGSTTWERCCLGLPTLSIITASNQEFIAKTLEKHNVQVNLGLVESLSSYQINEKIKLLATDHTLYCKMVESSSDICDGLGAQRVVQNIINEVKNDISLTLATSDDCSIVFKWQSTPELRKFSRNTNEITWQDHQEWFANTLKSKTRTLFIIEYNGSPCGILRLDILNNQTQEISILLSALHHGKNIASNAIKSIPLNYKKRDIVASVHPENLASHKLFKRAGFVQTAEDQYLLPSIT